MSTATLGDLQHETEPSWHAACAQRVIDTGTQTLINQDSGNRQLFPNGVFRTVVNDRAAS
jgi:hypothetical protein